MTTTVGIYARMSDDPTGTGAGVNRQVEDARALCARRGWTPAPKPYVDNDLSAYQRTVVRPDFERLLKDTSTISWRRAAGRSCCRWSPKSTGAPGWTGSCGRIAEPQVTARRRGRARTGAPISPRRPTGRGRRGRQPRLTPRDTGYGYAQLWWPPEPARSGATGERLYGYRYAVSENVVRRSPVAHVRRTKLGNDSPTLGLDKDQAKRLLRTAREHSGRAHALVALLIYDGLRISEALGADIEDMDTDRGHHLLRIRRKGGARRNVTLNPATIHAIKPYLREGPEVRTTGPIFATRTGNPLDRAEAWRLIRRLATDAEIPSAGRISPHSLRHTFVTLSREAGVPLEDVQDHARHAEPHTTRRYDRGRYNLQRSPAHSLGHFLAEDE